MKSLTFAMTVGCLASGLFGQSSDCSAQARLWGTYYGGTNIENANKIATDASGNVYVVGATNSPDGIATPNGFDSVLDISVEPSQGYLAKFNPSGMLVWATYYGDAQGNWGEGEGASVADLGLDASGNVYIVGTVVCPSQGLATPGAHDMSCDEVDAFVAKFSPSGKRLWGTYFGGDEDDTGQALSVMPTGEIYVAGYTHSAHGLALGASKDASFGGLYDGYVAKFNAQGQLIWSRYYGGEDYDFVTDIACKRPNLLSADICFITGLTESTNSIASVGAHDTVRNGDDAFVARLDTNGIRLWGTYYGGSGHDSARSIAVDNQLNVYVGGNTDSNRSMATLNTHDVGYNGGRDMFVGKFNAIGQFIAGTYYGNSADESLEDIAVDTSGNVYVFGDVKAHGWLVTVNAYDTSFNGIGDTVIARFNPNLTRSWATYYGGNKIDTASGIAVGKNNHVYVTGVTNSSDALSTAGSHQQELKAVDSFVTEFIQ
ncbi:MAG TPA: SBBP repeat-containing protein [Luteimonas sp.]|nr:SBBP repeat-containing protein [Luteimonas sp.]